MSLHQDNLWPFTRIGMTVYVRVNFSAKIHTGNEVDGVIPVTVVATGVASFAYTIILRLDQA